MALKKDGWIGVDFDGTLAQYDGWKGGGLGLPVAAMVDRVKRILALGIEVRVFTARISDPDKRVQVKVRAALEAWCLEHIGQVLKVTDRKDFSMWLLFDDRCVQVERNTGRLVGLPEGDDGLGL